MADSKVIRAFISSPFNELREHRRIVAEECRRFNIKPNLLEDAPPQGMSPEEFVRREVEGHDLFILILRAGCGSRPTPNSLSFTQIEFQAAQYYAQHSNIEIIVFLAYPESITLKDLKEQAGDHKENLVHYIEWRCELESKFVCDYFSSPDELRHCARKKFEEITGKTGSPSATLAELFPAAASVSFIQMLTIPELQTTLEKHFERVRKLGYETADNENTYIALRREFYTNINNTQRTQLLATLREFSAASTTAVGSALVAYELGRVYCENRQGEQAYELLAPLEDAVNRLPMIPTEFKARILDGIGEAARFSDRTGEAKRLYRRILEELDPNNYFALKHIATIFRIKNDFSEARHYFEMALRVKRSHHVLFSLGYLFHDFRRFDEALPYYEECIQQLNVSGIKDYYRVYFKLACICLIQGQDIEAQNWLNQGLSSIAFCRESSIGLDDFTMVTEFAANLLMALVRPPSQARTNLSYCRTFIREKLDSLTPSVFYCAYYDVMRVLNDNLKLLPAAHNALGSLYSQQLTGVLDHLRIKHLLLQTSNIQAQIQNMAPDHDWLDIEVRLNSEVDTKNEKVLQALRQADLPLWKVTTDGDEVYRFTRGVVDNRDEAVRAIKKQIDTLLDHGALALSFRSENSSSSLLSLLLPYTAVVPSGLRLSCFSDYFYLPFDENGDAFVRIMSPKLMSFDPTTENRIFINPTIGCNVDCDYCYLPEYGISKSSKVKVYPSRLDACDYQRALGLFKHFESGRAGSLISIGSFCDPFASTVHTLTTGILEAIQPLGNPIQVATKVFPGAPIVERLQSIFAGDPAQLMINLSLNDFSKKARVNVVESWLEYSDRLPMTIYIKPFLDRTYDALDLFVELGRKYPEVAFVVGSFYTSDIIQDNLEGTNNLGNFVLAPSYISPVTREPSVVGVASRKENEFREFLKTRLQKPIFKTASCSQSVSLGIRDPLSNIKRPFCICEECTNFLNICDHV